MFAFYHVLQGKHKQHPENKNMHKGTDDRRSTIDNRDDVACTLGTVRANIVIWLCAVCGLRRVLTKGRTLAAGVFIVVVRVVCACLAACTTDISGAILKQRGEEKRGGNEKWKEQQ